MTQSNRSVHFNALLVDKVLSENHVPDRARELVHFALKEQAKKGLLSQEKLVSVMNKYNVEGSISEKVYAELQDDPIAISYGTIACP